MPGNTSLKTQSSGVPNAYEVNKFPGAKINTINPNNS